jgi:hypothetical protein
MVPVTPSHQFPLGMAMSLQRRLALLASAEDNDGAIVEDDYDSEFRYGGRPIEPLQTLDRGGRVVYVGSFSQDRAGHPAPRLRGRAAAAGRGRARGQVRDRLAHRPAPPGRPGLLHRPGLPRPPRPTDARRLRRTPPADPRCPRRPVHRPPQGGPLLRRPARGRHRPRHGPRRAGGGAGSGVGGRRGGPAPVALRCRAAQPARHRPRLWGHPRRPDRRGTAPAAPIPAAPRSEL